VKLYSNNLDSLNLEVLNNFTSIAKKGDVCKVFSGKSEKGFKNLNSLQILLSFKEMINSNENISDGSKEKIKKILSHIKIDKEKKQSKLKLVRATSNFISKCWNKLHGYGFSTSLAWSIKMLQNPKLSFTQKSIEKNHNKTSEPSFKQDEGNINPAAEKNRKIAEKNRAEADRIREEADKIQEQTGDFQEVEKKKKEVELNAQTGKTSKDSGASALIEEHKAALRKLEEDAEAFRKRLEKIDKLIEEISVKISPETCMNHIAMHLMMDKLFINQQDTYEGSMDIIPSLKIRQAIERLAENQSEWNLNEQCTKYLLDANEKLCLLLTGFEILFRRDFKLESAEADGLKIRRDSLLTSLKELKVGESLLIPLGCAKHSTSLLVKRISANSFRLIHYNTGFGLKWHHRYPNSNLYQTHDIMDEVPAESVFSEEVWNAYYGLKIKENMDSAYEWCRDQVGKGGIHLPASENEEDYEAIQFSGTCPTQSKMALIRHEVMQLVEGTPAEKEAFYKLFKTYLFLQFIRDNEIKFDKTIEKHLPSVQERLNAELALVHIAQDNKLMDDAMATFKVVLSDKKIPSLSINSSFFERYAFLRKTSLLIFKDLNAKKIKISPELLECQGLQLVSSKLIHYAHIEKNIVELLKVKLEASEQSLIEELSLILTRTPHRDVALVEAVKYLGEEIPSEEYPPVRTKSLLTKLSSDHKAHDDLVKKLGAHLASKGNLALEKWSLDYWETLKSSDSFA